MPTIPDALLGASPASCEALVRSLPARELRALARAFGEWAHPGQLAPPGDWRTWVLMAGRGFGKTRAGAEWVLGAARSLAIRDMRIALVAATVDEARSVMVEGESGLLACARPGEIADWSPARRELRFASGATAVLFSGANPQGLRGPQHHLAWCDELAKCGTRRPPGTCFSSACARASGRARW